MTTLRVEAFAGSQPCYKDTLNSIKELDLNRKWSICLERGALNKGVMKINVAARAFYVSFLIVPESKAFAPPPSQSAGVMGNRGLDISRYQNRLQLHHCRIYDAIAPWSSNSIMKLSSTDRGKFDAVRGAARTVSRCQSKILSTSASSEGGSTAGNDETFRPSGPGAGLIDLHFQQLKSGGFKVFLLFFLLGVRVSISKDTNT